MKEIITKKSLMQTIDLISELDLNENDFNNIFQKFKTILNKPEIEQKLKETQSIQNSDDIKEIMTKIIQNLSINELNLIMGDLIQNEKLIDYIQDLFLEKLL